MAENTSGERLLSEVVESRRATPHFDGAPIPQADLHRILHAGLLAPSGYNLQPWRFIIVENAEQKAKLRVAALNQPKVEEASAVVVGCGDVEAWREIDAVLDISRRYGVGDDKSSERIRSVVTASLTGKTPDAGGFNGDPLAWVNRQVMVALTTMLWTAETLGYDTAPMEGFSASAVKAVLDLPARIHPVALLALGKLRGADKQYAGRLASESTCFLNTWGKGVRLGLP